MKRAGDRYPHKPSPGHTLDEVLKSLRDLIRNDLAAPATPPVNEPPQPEPPAQDEVVDEAVMESANPDPSAHELVDEVVAGLERELAELDDIDAGDDEPELQTHAESDELTEEDADDLPATDDVEFFAEAEPEVKEIHLETAVDENSIIDSASPDAEVIYPDASEGMILTEDTDAEHSEPAPELVPDDENVGRASARHVGLKADLQPLDSHGAEVSIDHPGSMAITDSETNLDAEPETDTGCVDLDALDAHVEDTPPATIETTAAPIPDPAPALPPTGTRERQMERPGERLRESLALIAPDDTAGLATPPQPTPKSPPSISTPMPEADAIPVLDQALDSHLPLDFQVRCRAIAIQATARFDRDMRREGRAPLSPDLVAHLARILEQALAQEFPESATPEHTSHEPQDS